MKTALLKEKIDARSTLKILEKVAFLLVALNTKTLEIATLELERH